MYKSDKEIFIESLVNRSIKFRAWGRYGEWEEDGESRKWSMIDGDSLCLEEFAPLCELLQSKEDVEYIMPHTGIKDINGKEIYEGDIYKSWYSRDTSGEDIQHVTHLVIWEHHNEFSGFDFPFLEHAEVIGNIFENPELLK